jgi:hypothetical protein
MRGKLFYRIFGTYLVIAGLAIGIVGILAGNQIRAKLEAQVENELMANARIVDLYPMKEIQARAGEIARIARARVTILDREGTWSDRRSRRPGSGAAARPPATARHCARK